MGHDSFAEPAGSPRELRLLSIVEATTVTGPLKPLLGFSALVRHGFRGRPGVRHVLLSTRRPALEQAGAADPLRQAVTTIGADFIAIPERRPLDTRVLAALHTEIGNAAPDIVETHDCKSHFLFHLLRRRHPRLRRHKWLAYHHGYTRTSLKVELYQQLDRISLRRADGVITLCRPFAADLSRRGVQPGKIHVLKNFVAEAATPSAADVAQARARLGVEPDECLILCVGRLSREKAQSDLIQALQGIASGPSTPALRLVLVGDGPERARLQSLAAPLGPKVVFAGHLADPWPLLNAADIFVLPSHSEGSPLVIFEAMAARLPIVATSVGGIPETLTHEADALLVPPRAPAELAAAILRLAGDAALRERLGAAAARALANHSPDAYASRLFGIYDLLLEKQ